MTAPTAASGSPMRCLSVSLIAMLTVAVAGCGGGDASGDTATSRAAGAPVTCPTQPSSSFYIYVKNTTRNTVKLRPASEVDCTDWSGAGNSGALSLVVPARTDAPAVRLRPVKGKASFLWSVTLLLGDMPDGVIGMQLTTKPSNPNAAFASIPASLLLSADGGTWQPDLITKSGIKYKVISDTCLTANCFTLRVSG